MIWTAERDEVLEDIRLLEQTGKFDVISELYFKLGIEYIPHAMAAKMRHESKLRIKAYKDELLKTAGPIVNSYKTDPDKFLEYEHKRHLLFVKHFITPFENEKEKNL